MTRKSVTVRGCAMCGAVISGKQVYCSDACKQSAYRARQKARVHERSSGREVAAPSVSRLGTMARNRLSDAPKCALPGCDNPTMKGKRAKFLTYCSESCKQKHKRQKWMNAKRNYNYAGR